MTKLLYSSIYIFCLSFLCFPGYCLLLLFPPGHVCICLKLCMHDFVCFSSCLMLLHIFCPGEDVYISLYGACEELSIHLEPDSILLKKTYISLTNVHKVSLANSSDIPLQYNWTTWASQQEEDLCLLRYILYVCRQNA